MSDTWRLSYYGGFPWGGGRGMGGVAKSKWGNSYQYIQTKWACHMPLGKRSKDGQENQPKTNRQRQPEEDTTVGALGGIIRA